MAAVVREVETKRVLSFRYARRHAVRCYLEPDDGPYVLIWLRKEFESHLYQKKYRMKFRVRNPERFMEIIDSLTREARISRVMGKDSGEFGRAITTLPYRLVWVSPYPWGNPPNRRYQIGSYGSCYVTVDGTLSPSPIHRSDVIAWWAFAHHILKIHIAKLSAHWDDELIYVLMGGEGDRSEKPQGDWWRKPPYVPEGFHL